MTRAHVPAILLILAISGGLSGVQSFAPPPSKAPDDSTRQAIADKTRKLGELIEALRRQGVRDPYLADVEIYHKAATWIARQDEYYQPEAGPWTLDALDRGLVRAKQVAQLEAPWLRENGQTIARAYHSRVDGSAQPYAVTFPADYGKDPNKKWRVDVVLHGRDPGLTEVKFLHQHAGQKVPAEQNFVRLDIYGRGNLGYRWAGESDIIEVIDNFVAAERILNREHLLDPARVVLRGFSMGGAGSWSLGLHNPSRWCVLGPGAGFTATHGYVKDLADKLPEHQEACLHIYDAVDYAENAFNVPVVAYAGADDPQLQAARNIEDRLKPLGIPMKLLIAPGLKHSFPSEWQKQAEAAYAPFLSKGREEYPSRVHFVTYTLRYPTCSWVEIISLDHHYRKSLVDAQLTETGYTIQTANVRALHLTLAQNFPTPLTVNLDGQTLTPRPYLSRSGSNHLYFDKKEGRWTDRLPQKILTDRLRRREKTPGLQGPIDDAFMSAFLCVRGTGTAWYESTQKFTDESLKRFQDEWERYFRGYLPIKDDTAVTEEDISGRHLVLFGDPASNSLINQVLDGLPLQWTKEAVTMSGKTVSSADHVPVLIYPSPLNTDRYVILNSGHTFHAAQLRGTNALLFPRLGDYAILRPRPTEQEPAAAEVVLSGLFDDFWQVPVP